MCVTLLSQAVDLCCVLGKRFKEKEKLNSLSLTLLPGAFEFVYLPREFSFAICLNTQGVLLNLLEPTSGRSFDEIVTFIRAAKGKGPRSCRCYYVDVDFPLSQHKPESLCSSCGFRWLPSG